MEDRDDGTIGAVADEPESRPGGIPLYVWVIAAVALAIPVGLYFGERTEGLNLLPKLIIRALTALAAPLVVLAILSAIVTNDIRGRQGARMMVYYLINTLVAMGFALLLANLIRPGLGAELVDLANPPPPPPKKSVTDLLVELIPVSIGDAFAKNNLAQLVLLTLALGIGLAKIRNEQRARGETAYRAVVDLLTVGFELLDAGPALGGRPGPAGGLRGRGVERGPEGRAPRLPVAPLADRRRAGRARLPGDVVPRRR